VRRSAGVLVLLAFLAAGCGGTSGVGASGADVVPAGAPAYISVNIDTDSSQWQTLDKLASRFPDKAKGVQALKQAARDQGFDWQRDVKPALGPEIDLVWLDFDNNGQNFVVLIKPDDKSKFDALLKKEQSGQDFVHEEIGGWQALAESQAVLDRFRRESGSGASLADKSAFNDAMSSYPKDTLFRLFVDGGTVMDLIRSNTKPEERKKIDKFGSLDWIAADLRVTSEGIRFDTNVHGTAGPAFKGITPTRAFAPALPKEVPGDAVFFATFHGTKGMLTGLKDNPVFGSAPELQRYADVLQRVESLLLGENALYVRPAAGKLPEVTFVAEPAPGTNGVTTLDRILARYGKELEFPSPPVPMRIAGSVARAIDFGPVTVYYANVGKHFVITNLPAGIKALKGGSKPLNQSEEFRGALDSAGVPAKTQGFFYINLKGGIDYAQRLTNTGIPGEVGRNLRPLRSAVEYALTRPSEIQLTLFIRIK
jgi:uncharacterized protein DUF3352